MSDTPPVTPDVDTLARLFYASTDELGDFEEVSPEVMPRPYRSLLAHNNHMTVTVESYHDSPVDVRVLMRRKDNHHYARKILLTRQTDGAVVQYGIMRINMRYLGEQVRAEIESEKTPLGRVLISHNLLREVELVALWKVAPGDELRELLRLNQGATVYGRTALIHVDGEPAVELLEIVTVED